MANHKSAKKRNRQTVRRTEVNRKRESQIKASLKKVESALASGKRSAAQAALKEAQPKLARGVKAGILKKGTVSRKMSRLSARVKNLAT